MPPKILVADDEQPIVDILAMVLEDAGYTVLRASDGAAARALVEREAPDLIISDIMMPHVSGVELARWVRRRPDGSDVPIVLLSAVRPATPVTPPADAFLPKPFDLDDVVALVARFASPA